jgi:hypothetical protein
VVSRWSPIQHLAARTAVVTLALLALAAGAATEREALHQQFRLNTALLPFSITAERRLRQVDAETWQMELVASHLIGTIRERTRFTWAGCVPVTKEYRYTREGLGQKREAHVRLDRKAGLAHVQHSHKDYLTYPVSAATTDKLSLTLALQCLLRHGRTDLVLDVAEERGVRRHRYRVEGEEMLQIPGGTVRTVRVVRDRGDDSNRKTRLWFAVEHDHSLVRLVQEEEGKRHELVIRAR